MFDYRYNGLPNMLTAQMPLMPQNMLSPMPEQAPLIDPMVTGGVQPAQQNMQVSPGDLNYFPPAPDANRAPITQHDYLASLRHLQVPQQQVTTTQKSSQPDGGMQQIAAFLQGLGRGNGVLSAIGGGLGAVQEKKQENQTVNYLTQRGIPEGEAQILSRNPQAVVQVLENLRKGVDPKTALELQKLGYEVEAARLKAQGGGASATEYGLNPIWGQDAQGNPVLGVLGKDGSFKKVDTGEFDISSGTEQIDLGDSFAIKDKRSGQIIGSVPKNLANAEREKVLGKASGERETSAEGDFTTAQNALDLIDNIRNDPYRERGTGASAVLNNVWGTGGYDFAQKVEQAKSGAFLTAIQQMKGLGALSNNEGAAATAAVTRMNTAMSEQGFLDALADYEKIVKQGMERARKNLPSGSGASPASNTVDFSDYFKQ
ncbi:hypothetical protein [Paenochrobactrum glaciei]|uniref:Uncharacterized protein n=1 Tax=Paenochrobactrum glaciei TaxID=486407 RepID=A0ABN1GK88_9HYPH